MSVRSNYNGTFEPLRNAVYKYFTWLSIPDNTVKTEELTAPRIRDAPDAPEVPSLQIQNGNFAMVLFGVNAGVTINAINWLLVRLQRSLKESSV